MCDHDILNEGKSDMAALKERAVEKSHYWVDCSKVCKMTRKMSTGKQ